MSEEIIIKNKKLFARDSIGWLRLIILVQSVFLGSLLWFAVVQIIQAPEPRYFAFKKGDQLISSASLEQPGLTYAELLNWVTEAMIVSFSFNYHNYDKIADKVEEYFDSIGFASYVKMITEHPYIQQVVKKKLVLSGRPTGAPRIIEDGVIDGKYAWEVAVPFILKFRNQATKLDIELVLDVMVARVPEQVAPLGVKIVQIQDYASIKKVKSSAPPSQEAVQK